MHIIKFFEWVNNWRAFLPKEIKVSNGKEYTFKLGNIMEPSTMSLQITYDDPTYGFPDTFEIDVYKLDVDGKPKIDIEMTCGDFVMFSFTIFEGKISIVEDSEKFWGTDKYCLTGNTIKDLSHFFSHISNCNIDINQLGFLCPMK